MNFEVGLFLFGCAVVIGTLLWVSSRILGKGPLE